MNHQLKSHGNLSVHFLKKEITTFEDASIYIKNLPYRRNLDKFNILCVLEDKGGTCSTKHALLKNLADEINFPNVKLMLGIFKMNAQNTPKINFVLQKYNLLEIPEAHNYLKINYEVHDFTNRNSSPENFLFHLVEEIEIHPDQITSFKVEYHKNFLKKYLENNLQINFTPDQFWEIREECITVLQK